MEIEERFIDLDNIQIRSDQEISAYEERLRIESIKKFHSNCGLDSDFFGAKIDYEKYSLETIESLKNFVQNVRDKKGGFLIINGTVGTGKTSAAAAVMNELVMGTYFDMLELDLKLNSADRYNSQESREQFMHRLARCELLVLDEIGRFPDRKNFEQPILFYLLNRRFHLVFFLFQPFPQKDAHVSRETGKPPDARRHPAGRSHQYSRMTALTRPRISASRPSMGA